MSLARCGVKGDPLPPEVPPALGRGRPTYKRATEELVIQHKSASPAQQQQEEKDSDHDDDQQE